MYKRFLLGALVVVLASATTVATAALLEVKDYADIIGKAKGGGIDGKGVLDNVDPGGPQTILLLGSDRRYADIATKAPVRSDTIILVRLDPSKGATAVMSLPRDLKVRIPNHGTDKINAAYAIGGPKLTVKTVKQLLDIPVNHVINVNFGGFRKAVDRLKCVYVDVDRRYFNDNNPPYGGGSNYATIDVKAGYQKLCGQDALDFVRYRHFDSDLVRGARQQEFLRQAKEQIGVSKVLTDRKGLLRVFADYTQTDIRGSTSILQLIKLAVESARHPVQEVHFPGHITGDYVTVSQREIAGIRQQFMDARASPGARGDAVKRKSSASKKPRRASRPATPSMAPTPSSVQDQAVRMAADLPFAVYYPKSVLSGSEYLIDHGRSYSVSDRGGHRYRAYRLVVKTREIGQYYGIQGTNWAGPPILDNPSETRKIGGRSYNLFFDGDRLRIVSWRSGKAVYWVSNTLLQTLTNQQMLAVARAVSKVQ